MVTKADGSTDSGNQDTNTQGGESDSSAVKEGSADSTKPDGKEGEQGGNSLDESKLDEASKAYIRNLRKENAKYRTRANAAETALTDTKSRLTKIAGGKPEAELTAEQVVEQTSARAAAAEFDNALLGLAIDHGIGKEGLSYFRFLVSEKAAGLGEGEELDEDALTGIAKQVQSVTGKRSSGSTSVGTSTGGGSPSPGVTGEVTLDQFCAMGVLAKGKLYQDNPEAYTNLHAQAIQHKRLV
jgi:hypothetical protein